jgi:hypothetical protein
VALVAAAEQKQQARAPHIELEMEALVEVGDFLPREVRILALEV